MRVLGHRGGTVDAGRRADRRRPAEGAQRKALGVWLDVLDVARDDFLIAGDAWLRCRAGLADPGKSG
ncbi:MAG TPA: hypothetical protein VHZ03_04605 [Trebonia sp.]|nr:hypothetical protein [Trebonia sp.]